jgi:hypothetical protein
MDTGKILGQIVAKIRDQRLLFLIAVIIAVTILARTKTISAQDVIIIFSISAAVVLVDRSLEFLGRRPQGRNGHAGNLNMSIALDFEGVVEGTSIRLVSGTCTIQNPRSPRRIVQRSVLPYPGGLSWLCPIPSQAGPDDVISFTLTDSQGNNWGLTVVPRLLWPRIKIERLP